MGRLRYCSFRETPCRRACRRDVGRRFRWGSSAGYEFNGCAWSDHVGYGHLFEGSAHDGVDALPVAADVALGFDTAAARARRAFCKAERLFIQSVYNVGDADVFSSPAECIAPSRAACALQYFTLRERLEHLADHGLAQPKR